ncbi:MAG TPA: hypothetical protein PLJ35_06040 [Anaerolineae bacterium]|nr:hypothetical protein [Anaerolineae bacterium]HOQ98365.1 hypothetical protein [Anaerolineae bacterium]HPL26600.1 hypothetical protein [Anaerolineae bacterium]
MRVVVLGGSGVATPELVRAIAQGIGAIPSPCFKYVFHPDRMLASGPVPPIRGLIAANCAYEMIVAEAIIARDRTLALRALLVSPFKCTYDQALGVLERAWGEG